MVKASTKKIQLDGFFNLLSICIKRRLLTTRGRYLVAVHQKKVLKPSLGQKNVVLGLIAAVEKKGR
ncbi:MAG: hypothetical protein FJZ62_04615 [Chlamydiae bacterium]|nr:hypothetical protein [Chlamydiota bacterium]